MLKIAKSFLCILLVLLVIFGFDFSLYDVQDLTKYNQLDFEMPIKGMKKSINVAMSDSVNLVASAADTLLGMFSLEREFPDHWTGEHIAMYQALSIEDTSKFVWFLMNAAYFELLPVSVLEKAYSIHFERNGIGGDN